MTDDSHPGPAKRPSPAAGNWSRFLGALSARRVVVAVVLAVAVAATLNPIFIPPFPVLLGRTLFVAMVLLVVYAAARQWPPRRLPRWVPPWIWPVLAVGLAAPVVTFGLYLLQVGGDVIMFVNTPERVWGFLVVGGSALVLGLLFASGAAVRERLAEARTRELALELERSRLEKQALDARLSLLQAQIEPHFLFNTLANVQALVEQQSPRAADVLKSLVAYLRAAMPHLHEGQATLGHELRLVQAYLELMRMRMPDRLQFAIDVDMALHTRSFPAMALLTLVENAVRHGIDPSEEGGRVDIGAQLQADGLHLWVADTGAGLDPHAQPGTGLPNLRERLAGAYGPRARVDLSEVQPHGVRAEIVLPS